MASFIKSLCIFLLPPVIILGIPCAVMFFSGEFYSMPGIENEFINARQPVLLGTAYSAFFEELKFEMAQRKSPEVLALGTSKAGMFSSLFFKDPNSFYAASNAVHSLSDFSYFIRDLGSSTPKVLIIPNDASFFDPAAQRATHSDPFIGKESALDIALEALIRNGGWWKVYGDYFAGKYSLQNLFDTGTIRTVGLFARTQQNGILPDGSYHYGSMLADPAEQSRIQEELRTTPLPTSTNPPSRELLLELRSFLELCKEKHIYVIGFMPPLSGSSYVEALAQIYRSEGFEFYDFSEPVSFGSSDAEMIDAIHGSEKMYLRMFIAMAKMSPSLSSRADLPYLQNRLVQATSSLEVFSLGER